MIATSHVIGVVVAYVAVLFAIAYAFDKRLRWLAARPRWSSMVYTLSIAVYCTSWTFYGSVGLASRSGVDFLPIYLGPTLVFCLAPHLLHRMVRVSKHNRITSIADFIATRYGRSAKLAGTVTVIAVVGLVPYIALQLKAVAASFLLLVDPVAPPQTDGEVAVVTAAMLAVFAMLFGTRQLDLSESRPGLASAIAFDSVVKLLCLSAVGLFVGYALFDGFGDLFAQAARQPALAGRFRFDIPAPTWSAMLLLSMAAAFCLPRQFQMMVVEQRSDADLRRATWAFPLYLLLINLFVLPIALAGDLLLPAGRNPDLIVLDLPLAAGAGWLAVLAFLGGVSAATAMVVVETLALGAMVSNDLVMPVLLRLLPRRVAAMRDLTRVVLQIRRVSIIVVLALGLIYMQVIGQTYALFSIRLVSFAAIAQLAPAIVLGLYWRGAGAVGAMAGLIAGFAVWGYTLFLPSLARSGLLPVTFIETGLFHLDWTRPYALFGLTGLDPIAHCLFWSLLANAGLLIGCSILVRPSARERTQALAFMETSQGLTPGASVGWRSSGSVKELIALVGRFIGPARASARFADLGCDPDAVADPATVQHAERLLTGVIGGASARVLLASAVKESPLGVDELMLILDESSALIRYSRRLEDKSRELEAATSELQSAYESLKQLDRMKDEFVSTASHELRTPLTSIRSFAEILYDNPELDAAERQHFLGIIIQQSERLTRLINDMLDLAKIEAGAMDWHMRPIMLADIVYEAAAATDRLFADKAIAVSLDLAADLPPVRGDADRLSQVLINLLSNAAKFAPPAGGAVRVTLSGDGATQRISVSDNGPGIAVEDQAVIFERFRQVGGNDLTMKPQGSGLGLPICRMIMTHHGGSVTVESAPGAGATFVVTVPTAT